MLGKFITLEGGEGAGKSTQAALLFEFLARKDIKAITTREVGGTPAGEEIRALWLNAEEGQWDVVSEILLIMAARREHLVKKIWPALETGLWVISDRFVDSTRVYQGVVQGAGLPRVDALYREISGDFWPDLTLLLDLPVETGLARMAARRGADDRFEQQDQTFHQKLRDGFLTLQAMESDRIKVIDANGDPESTATKIHAALVAKFDLI